MKRAALLAFVLLAVTGCGKAAKHTQSTGVGDDTCAPLMAGSLAKSSPTKPSQTMLLTDLKVDSEPCADRVILTFRTAGTDEPGFRVEYQPAAEAQTEDGSGKRLAIAGNVFLVVRLEPAATADISGSKLERTYTGPRTITPAGMHYVREVTKSGDFEAVLRWTIGLSEKRPFKVTTSGSPPRLTIEIG